MPRGKDQKTISKRIDLHYWKKSHPFRTSRKFIVLGCVLLAAGWLAYAYATKSEKLFNPGHVTIAHATIEHKCAECHAPDPEHKGQFLAAVSDSACMKCHEAPMHVPTQLAREGDHAKNPLALAMWTKPPAPKKPTEPPAEMQEGERPAEGAAAAAVAQPMDAHHGGVLVSSQCATCHVEHRGREALAAVSNSHCTQCHADINKAISPGKTPAVPVRVVAFSKTEHPDFGRHLARDDRGLIDPTKLNFNHKLHIVDQKLNDCSMCHTTWTPNPLAFRPGKDSAQPPFITVKPGEMPMWSSVSDGRYMQPVSFEQNCKECHALKVKDVGTVSHDKMEIVRAEIYAAFQKTAVDRYAAGPVGAAKAGGKRGASAKTAGPADEGDWLREQLEKLNKAVDSAQKKCAQCHEMAAEAAVASATTSVSESEFNAMLQAASRKSNVVIPAIWDGRKADVRPVMQRRPGGAKRPSTETPAPAPAPDNATAAPSTDTPPAAAAPTPPAAPEPKPRPAIKTVALQTTVPTGIPKQPRRWFASSRFDHRSHRDMACVECHSKLDNLDKIDGIEDEALKARLTAAATETREVLSPGIEWTVNQFTSSGDKWKVSTSTRSCTECHRGDTKDQRFTTAACTTCHAYHDHSKEIFPDGRIESRVKSTVTMGAPMAAPAAPAAAPAPSKEAEPAKPEAASPAPETPAPTPAVETPAPETTPAPAPAEEAKPAEPAPAEPAPSAEPPKKGRRPKTISGAQ